MIEVGHKGTLELASEGLGKGSTATMRVPVQWADKSVKSPPKSDPLWWVAPHPGATADILVVGDKKRFRLMTILTGKKYGLTVEEASGGTKAVERLRTNTYSIVFIDRQMPEMNGGIVAEQARVNGYTLPIVMVSADLFTPSEEAKLKRRGITAFLHKMSVPGSSDAMKKLKEMKSDPLWWVAPHPDVTADILVVDDSKMVRMMTSLAAKKSGLTFDHAVDGTEAVKRLRTNTFSIVFMDRQMPEMNGDIATEQARANGYALPIVMVSADTFSASEKVELKGRGMTAFLNKMAVPGVRHALLKLKEMK
jgi:CheY-like chemotaxis protein